MQTKRDRFLITLLLINAALSAAAGSSALFQLAPPAVAAGVGLLSAMVNSVTAAYVAITRETEPSPERPA